MRAWPTIVAGILLGACAGPAPEFAAAPRGPHVVLIIADDQGWADLSCGPAANDVATPAIDRLAARGVRFTRAYATSPICNTSRMGLMLGAYHQRLGSLWYGGDGIEDARFSTLAEVMRDAGYATAYVGKCHYGRQAVHVPGNRNFPLEHGYDSFYGFSGGRKHYLVHVAQREWEFGVAQREHGRKLGQSLRMGPLWEDDRKVDALGFTTELFGDRAVRLIRQHSYGEKPLFLTLSFNAVHNFTHQLPERYAAGRGLGAVRDWDPAEEPYYDWYRRGRYPNNSEGRAAYLGQLQYLDGQVGRVLDELERLHMAEDTIVIYVGDNGGSTPIYADNGPLRGSKYTLYEGGLRVPLIVSWPRSYQEGVVRDNVVSAMDLLPTIARACGARVPDTVDGLDLGRLLTGRDPSLAHSTLHFETRAETSVLHGHWKFKTAVDDTQAAYEMVELEVGEFLYDMKTDPREQLDVAAQHPEVVAELKAKHAAWRAEVGLDN